jgi:DNA-binding NtrC family response regulator
MKIRAFVFDDDEQVRSLVSSTLLQRGYEVHDFAEPGTCPLYLERECPCPESHTCGDIIITDIDMPDVTGLELIENQIKRSCKVRHFGVMSGTWSNSVVKHASELGCKIFKKPFGINELRDWLDQCEKTLNPSRKLWDWFRYKK